MTDTTETLQQLMQQAQITSYRALADQAEVSRWQVQQLRQGNIAQMRLSTLQQIAVALNLSLVTLLETFEMTSGVPTANPSEHTNGSDESLSSPQQSNQIAALKKEYSRLQAQLESTTADARQSLQREALDTIESWLVQWPTIAHLAQENESLAAAKVVKFVDPVMRMIESWGVSAIAPVGTTVSYDPQCHQLKQGTTQPGSPVKVISPGYRYQGKLLHKAQVRPPNNG